MDNQEKLATFGTQDTRQRQAKQKTSTVKPSHVVTFLKQSPVLKGHLLLVQSLKISYEFNLF
jgi:hypothetical protein